MIRFVSVKSNGTSPSHDRTNSPSIGCAAATALAPAGPAICRRVGFSGNLLDSAIHFDQSLRNHSVGRRMKVGRVRSPIDRGDAHEDVLGRRLGVLYEHVEVAVVIEDARVEELVLHVVAGAPAVRLQQVGVRKGCLGVLVEVFMYECVGVLSR